MRIEKCSKCGKRTGWADKREKNEPVLCSRKKCKENRK